MPADPGSVDAEPPEATADVSEPGKKSSKEKIFYLGLTMAGAVSAGAYTAGVLDFLFRAIDAHNRRVDLYHSRLDGNDPITDDDWPRHYVVVKVMSGASAGSMCAGLAVAGLVQARMAEEGRLGQPKPIPHKALEFDADKKVAGIVDAEIGCVLAPLYDAWVSEVDLWRSVADDEARSGRGEGLLSLSDLNDPDRPVVSIFNGDHIERVAEKAVGDIRTPEIARPYSFLAREFEIFFTTTDVKGLSYKIGFAHDDETGGSAHRMAQHSVVRHFRVVGLGCRGRTSPWLTEWRDSGILLDLGAEGNQAAPLTGLPTWRSFMASALASGAFPLGLAPQRIDATYRELGSIDELTDAGEFATGGALPIDTDPDSPSYSRPDFGEKRRSDDPAPFIAVDGGIGNNEPFEHARFALRKRAVEGVDKARHDEPRADAGIGPLLRNPRSSLEADRAVIMIDPFPEGHEYAKLDENEAEQLRGLMKCAQTLIPALMGQARFKPVELIHAGNPDIRSRFLISPQRNDDALAPLPTMACENLGSSGAGAIACGAFGGFSGFLDQSFRLHDFVLGQRNCQRFIEKHLMLAAHNPVLGAKDTADALANASIQDHKKWNERPIISPGKAMLGAPIGLPPWPRISQPTLDTLLARLRLRLGLVGGRLLAGADLRLYWLWRLGFRRWFCNRIESFVFRVLLDRDQIETYAGRTREERLVLRALISSKGSAKTAKALLCAARQDPHARGVVLPIETEVRDMLNRLSQSKLVTRSLWTTRHLERRYRHRPY